MPILVLNVGNNNLDAGLHATEPAPGPISNSASKVFSVRFLYY